MPPSSQQTYAAPPSGPPPGPPPAGSGAYGGPSAGSPPAYAGPPSQGYGAPPSGPGPAAYGPGSGYGPGYGTPARPAAIGGVNFTATFSRLGRLLKYDTSIFREAAHDATALIPGLVVAAVSILVMAIGTWLWAEFKFDVGFDSGEFFWKSVLVGTVTGTVAWAAWVAIAGLLLQQMFRRQVSIPNLLGAMGLATFPFLLGLLALIDFLYLTFAIVPLAGTAMLSQTALQEATDASPGEAFIANLTGFLVFALILLLLGRDDSQLAPGIFAVNLWSAL